MPFTDPQTVNNPTAGQPATAAWGDAVRDATYYLATSKPHARLFYSSTTGIPTSTWTPISFPAASEQFDVGGCHSDSAQSQLIVPAGEGGKYLIGGTGAFASHATGERIIGIRLNGSTFLARTRFTAGAADPHTLSTSTLYDLAAGDYVELCFWQDSGGNLNVTSTNYYTPNFWWTWMATS